MLANDLIKAFEYGVGYGLLIAGQEHDSRYGPTGRKAALPVPGEVEAT